MRFRLIDLAVGLWIGGLLIMFIFVALPRIRAETRKMSCENHLKQLGLALHTYHTTYSRLPPNGLYLTQAESNNPFVGSRSLRGSPFLKLHPFLESSPLYNGFNFDLAGKPGQFEEEIIHFVSKGGDESLGTYRAGSYVLQGLLCPSANVHPTLNRGRNGNAVACYAFSMGAQRMPGRHQSCVDYPGNVFGTGSAPLGLTSQASKVSGVFARGHWAARFGDLVAGQSNVIMMGETLPDKSYHHGMGWLHAFSPFASTTSPVNFPTRGIFDDGSPGAWDCHHYKNVQTSDGFRSAHPGGAQFLMASGATSFLNEKIDYRLYQQLGDRFHKIDG